MASKAKIGEFMVDGIGTLEAGINTGLAPQLLPPNQASMATNMTFRGGYGTHRPPIREINLDFNGSSVLEQSVIRQPFQGACFYQPDTGPQSLIASIGGRLFQFTPSETTCPVIDISINGDANPPNPQQAWLWQCERFIIVNDGVSLPIFFDGNISRRSNGTHKVLATIDGSFITPSVNDSVDVDVTEPYTGPVNIPVFVNGKQFTLLGSKSTDPNALAVALYDPDTSHGIGENIISYPNRIGTLLQTIPSGVSSFQAITTVIQNPSQFINTGAIVQVGNKNFQLETSFGSDTTFGQYPAKKVAFFLVRENPAVPSVTPSDIPAGSIITVQSSAPTPTIGKTESVFTPNYPNGSQIIISPPLTLPSQVVWIGKGIYQISPLSVPPSSKLTLQNVDGNPGDPMTGDITALPELPPGRMGAYGMGRNWMALTDGTSFIASDIVGGTSGTEVYSFRDAPLRITENNYLAGGGSFRIPGALGDIRAMRFNATLDVSLGQGPLQVFTPMAAFSCNAPVDRTTWSNVTNPILTQSLLGSGSLSQNGTRQWNNDILFRSVDGIRSLVLARREFDTWGNVPQSREVDALLSSDNASLIQFESLEIFENRALLSVFPTNGPLGVYHQGIIALNADPISTLRGKSPSIYDGLWTGMNIFQLVQGVFNGVDRCYAFCFDAVLSRIRLFEIQKTADNPFDNGVTPVTYSFESAALFNNTKIKGQFDLAELQDGEIYISDVRGVVNFEVWYRPNYSECWTKWTEFGICGNNIDSTKPMQYRTPIGLGSPSVLDCDPNTKQPCRIGLTFQVRFQISGACKFRGARFKATLVPEQKFTPAQCRPLCDLVTDSAVDCEPCVDQNVCLQFPLVLYNLNANKTYSNELTVIDVTCPDNSVQQVPVPAGTINYTLPFAPGFTGDYPPLIMNCLSGGVIVKTVPTGATQEQIDVIVNDMIAQCVEAYAKSIAQCGSPVKIYSSEQVTTTHTCADGETLKYNGTLPSWISIDGDTGVITGNAGVITSTISVEDATTKAQSQLNDWVQSQLSLGNLACQSAGPTCINPIGNIPIPYQPTGEQSGTKDATVRRIALLSPTTSEVVFINTDTNSIIGATTLSGLTNISRGDFAAFATSTKKFYVTVTSGVYVLDGDGNLITTVAFPPNTTGAVSCIYSPIQDRVYTICFNSSTSSRHIIVINPHTNTVVNDVDTGFADYVYIYYAPVLDQMVIQHDAFSLESWDLSTVTQVHTLSFSSRYEMDYAPNAGKWFVPAVQFSPTYQLTVIDGATLTVLGTIDLPSFTGVTQYVKYNPVTGAILAFSFNGEIAVIDPLTLTVICELADEDEFNGAISVDYSNGHSYFLDWNGADNPLLIYD